MSAQAPRKIVFIDKKFQASFILKFLLLLLVGTVIFDVAAYLILNRRLDNTLYQAHLAIQSVSEILMPALIGLSLVFIVVLGVAALIITLFVSHLIAGPLFAIRRYLENMGEGNLDFQAKLRSKDQTTPLAQSLSQSLQTLNSRLLSLRETVDELSAVYPGLKQELNSDQALSAEAREKADRVAALIVKLSKDIDFFKLRSSQDAS